MAITLFFLLSILLLGGTSSGSGNGEMSPEAYWKKLLPKTPIPDSLHPFLPKDLAGSEKENVPKIFPSRGFHWTSELTPKVFPSRGFHWTSGAGETPKVFPSRGFHWTSGAGETPKVFPTRGFHWTTGAGETPKVFPSRGFHWTTGAGETPKVFPTRGFHWKTGAGETPKVFPSRGFHWTTGAGETPKVFPSRGFHWTTGAGETPKVFPSRGFHWTTGASETHKVFPNRGFHWTSGAGETPKVFPDRDFHWGGAGVKPEELRDTEFLFLEESLKPGSKTKKMDFVKKERDGHDWPALLPRSAADALPFSISKLDDILKYFSIQPTSAYATEMKKTLTECEEKSNKGETRYCATSLESMVDFAISQLKTNNITLLSTSVLDKETAPKDRVYTVQNGVTKFPYKSSVVCHISGYPYAVFFCHNLANTSSYILPLVAEEDGSKVNAAAVCHTETSSWDPNQAGFHVLGVKPGTPVCHFLPYGHFAWVANSAP